MKNVVMAVITAVSLAGCNLGSTHLMPDYVSGIHKFENIDVKNTNKSNRECEITIPLLLILRAPLGKSDISIMNIAQRGKIDKITYVDEHVDFIFPFYGKKCYTVYGY